jgi:hypothetical protein
VSAQVFLAAFLGCLFALVAVRIATWQFKLWFLRRVMRRVYKGQPFVDAGGMPPTMPPTMPPSAPSQRIGTAHCSECDATQGITDDEAGVSILNGLGWRRDDTALYCKTCAPKHADAREIAVEQNQLAPSTMSSVVHFVCDACASQVTFDSRALLEVKAQLNSNGWRIGDCVCPSCAAKTAASDTPNAT